MRLVLYPIVLNHAGLTLNFSEGSITGCIWHDHSVDVSVRLLIFRFTTGQGRLGYRSRRGEPYRVKPPLLALRAGLTALDNIVIALRAFLAVRKPAEAACKRVMERLVKVWSSLIALRMLG